MSTVAGRLGVLALLAVTGLAGCASLPEPTPAAVPSAGAVPPVVEAQQAQDVRAEVAARLRAAQQEEDADLVDLAATGPAAELALLQLELEEPALPGVGEPEPVSVLLAPQVQGWPRWFASVTEGDGLPVLDVYAAAEVREPYRLWGRLTMLPGEELPAFAAAELGAESLAAGTGGPAPSPEPDASQGSSAAGEEPSDAGEEPELQDVLAGLGTRYAELMAEGAASTSAAEFAPDPFVEAVRLRAQAEQDAVSGVAGTTVDHRPLGGEDVLFAARSADGDVLAFTAVETATTTTVRPGAGVLLPGEELAEAAGIDETDDTLTTRSVAALAFVVPAEQGAIRLVAVGEGLVAAQAP